MNAGAVHLACGPVDALLLEAPAPESWLTFAERERLAGMHTARRRAQFVAARWQARRVLAAAFGGGPADWPLTAPHDAPPGVAGRDDLQLSVSHSGDWAACAVAGEPVGLDLEAPQRQRDIAGLVALCCTPPEQALVRAAADAQALFYQLWTVKEAWLKRRRDWIAPRRLRQVEALPAAAGDAQARTWSSPGWTLALCGAHPVQWWTPQPASTAGWQVSDAADPS
jgi:4'-phosphopantetheinyl transferase